MTANLPSSSIKNSLYADVTTIVQDLPISHGGMHRRVHGYALSSSYRGRDFLTSFNSALLHGGKPY